MWWFIGAALTGIGVGVSVYSQNKQAKAQEKYQKEQLKQQQAAEAARRKQMELDGLRRQRENVRSSQRARAAALSTTVNQNAQGGSGLMGAYGQAQGQFGVNQLGVSQNLDLGRQIFDSNAAITQASSNYAGQASRYGQMAGIGGGLTTLGGAYVSNLGAIQSLTTYGSIGTPWSGGQQFGGTESTGLYDPWEGMR